MERTVVPCGLTTPSSIRSIPWALCGAPLRNEGPDPEYPHRLLRVLDWVEHIKDLGATCVLFNPLFESDAHGYDTRDFSRVDCRLGTNEDLKNRLRCPARGGPEGHAGRGFQPCGAGILGRFRM